MLRVALLGVLPLAALVGQPAPESALFHSTTRLVEVEVTVRHQRVRPSGTAASWKYYFDSGPPFGPPGTQVRNLTRSDFTLLDQGKPQPITVFSSEPRSNGKSVALPPGAASNWTDNRGQRLNSATVVLVDLLNTPWALTEYARVGTKELLRSLKETDTRIALYSLGEQLHILHDFTDDPQNLMDAAAVLDQPDGQLPPAFSSALRDYGDLTALGGPGVAAEIHGRITLKALSSIIRHLSGVPGRKNLVWLAQAPRIPPTVMTMMQQANIVLYPVRVRGLGGFADLESESTRDQGTASGGRGFFDARDLTFAVQTAEEDSRGAYVLGYYPTEDMLDGKFHKITVSLSKEGLQNEEFEVHYRSGYLATKIAALPPTPTLVDLIEDPIASTGIGLAAQATPDARRPGFYDVRLTVDLHDIHLDRKDGHSIGAIDFAVPNPSSQLTIRTGRVDVNFTDEQLVGALESGVSFVVTGVESQSDEIRIVVRDRATGTAGSLRFPVAETSGDSGKGTLSAPLPR